MISRRKLKRFQLITQLHVLEGEAHRPFGMVLDINVEGLSLRAPEVLGMNKTYRLRVELPGEIRGTSSFDVTARCAWCAKSDNPDLFDAGMQFVGISPDAVEAIEELVRRFRR